MSTCGADDHIIILNIISLENQDSLSLDQAKNDPSSSTPLMYHIWLEFYSIVL